jgi:hypothetical protein
VYDLRGLRIVQACRVRFLRYLQRTFQQCFGELGVDFRGKEEAETAVLLQIQDIVSEIQ